MGTVERDEALKEKRAIDFAVLETIIVQNKIKKADADFLRELHRLRFDWQKGADAYREVMFQQGAIDKFKQETIRKLTGEESDLVDMVSRARFDALELLKEKNQLTATIRTQNRTIAKQQMELKAKQATIERLARVLEKNGLVSS